MTDDAETFGARLRAFRLLADLSQEGLAERSGVSVRTISNLEREHIRKPYRSTCRKLADALALHGTARAQFLAASRRQGEGLSAEEQVGGAAHHAAGSLLIAPRHLPSQVANFVGRCHELAGLSRVLGQAEGTPAIAVISGPPGVGKTALALRWAHEAGGHQFSDGQLYVDLHGYGPEQPVSAADALASLLRALGVAGLNIPEGTAERAAAYRGLLAAKQVLVVLDNASDSAQVRPLLPGSGRCAVLVTSRDPLAGLVAREGASRLELDVLPDRQAVDLLRRLIGSRVDEDLLAAAMLARYCSRLPLALRVAAELAIAQPLLPLAALAGQLADLRHRVCLLDAGGDKQTAVQSVLSWSYRQLGGEAARAFRLLGQHPGLDFDAYAAAALAGTTIDDARQILHRLNRVYLIRSSEPGRYNMHDLLRAYAREFAAGDQHRNRPKTADQEAQDALGRLFAYYLHTAANAVDTLFAAHGFRRTSVHWEGDSPSVTAEASARAWLETELQNLVAAAQAAQDGWPSQACRLASAIYPYLERTGRVSEAITVEDCALRAAWRTKDKFAQATALGNLGHVFLMQGRYQRAAGHLRQSAAIFRQTGDQAGEATAVGALAVIHRRQGRYQQSAAQQTRALALARQLGDQWAEALALMRLGVVDRLQGRYEQALRHTQEALNVSRQIGDPLSEAEALTRLAVVELHLHRHQEAAAGHQLAIALFRRGGDPAGEAEASDGLGEVCLASGQHKQALFHHAQALRLAEETGDLNEQARAHHGLARAHQAAKAHAHAQSHLEQAITLFALLGAPEARQIQIQLNATDSTTPESPASDHRLSLTPGDGET